MNLPSIAKQTVITHTHLLVAISVLKEIKHVHGNNERSKKTFITKRIRRVY